MSRAKYAFFPGCSLPSHNPDLVANTLEYLQEKLPGTGAILKCCGKPTKALTQMDKFKHRFLTVQAQFDKLGVEEVIVACQSCFLTLNEYCRRDMKVTSLWTLIPKLGLPDELKGIGRNSDITFAVHDSCSTRREDEIHNGIRWIINELGYKLEDPPHSRLKALCCGFGGMVLPANPDLAKRIMNRRTGEVESEYMVTYCAACRMSMVMGGKKAIHILDLMFGGPWDSRSEFPGIEGSRESWVNRRKAKKAIERVLG